MPQQRQASLPQVLGACAVPNQPSSTPWDLEKIRRSVSKAQKGDVIHLWWHRPAPAPATPSAAHEEIIEEGITVVHTLPTVTPTILWRGLVDSVQEDGIVVRWPGTLLFGPDAAGLYHFPCEDFENGSAVVTGMSFVRTQSPARIAMTAVSATTRTLHARTQRPNTGRQFSFAFVPLIARAANHQPSTSTKATEWNNFRKAVGETLFDDLANDLVEAWPEGIDLEWHDDYIGEEDQNYIMDPIINLPQTQTFYEIISRMSRLRSREDAPIFQASSGPTERSDLTLAFDRMATALEDRKIAQTTTTLCRGLKIPASIPEPYTALYFHLWQDAGGWNVQWAALLALFVGFRTSDLRSRFQLVQGTIQQLWLGKPQVLDSGVPKEDLQTLWHHTADLVGILATTTSGEAAGKAAHKAVEKAFEDGFVDLKSILLKAEKTEPVPAKDAQKNGDAHAIKALSDQVRQLQDRPSQPAFVIQQPPSRNQHHPQFQFRGGGSGFRGGPARGRGGRGGGRGFSSRGGN